MLLAPGQKLRPRWVCSWKRCSYCCNCCPRDRVRRKKTSGFSLSPTLQSPTSVSFDHIQLKPAEVGGLKMQRARVGPLVNKGQSGEEWRTHLKAMCPREPNCFSWSTFTTNQNTGPQTYFCINIAPGFTSPQFILILLPYRYQPITVPHGAPIPFILLCPLNLFSRLSDVDGIVTCS